VTSPLLRTFPDTFETERLLIRAPRPGDGAELYAAVIESLPELLPWMAWAREPQTPESAEANVRQAQADFLLRRDLRLQLYLRSDPRTMVGSSGLHRIDWDVPRFEIGYWLRTRFAGRGYATEAARGVALFAFRELGAQRIEIWCDARNAPSAAVAQRLGFHQDAVLRDHARGTDGSLVTNRVFGLLRHEATAALGGDVDTGR
jgi:RimJ/RimL family protein N-acetyltransferase